MKINETRVAFITGAANGIGKAAALMLARQGATVVSFDNDDTELQLKSLEKILIDRRARSSYETWFVISFLINHKTGSAVRRCLPELKSKILIRKKYQKVDILINNAGDYVDSSMLKDPYEYGLAGLEKMLRLFAGSTYAFTLLAAPLMASQREGVIINVLTNHLHRDVCRVSPEEHAYDAAKYAQMSLNMSMAVELHPCGIRVNAVDPAATYTGMLRSYFADRGMDADVASIQKVTGTGSLMMPEDVALAICNLIREEDPAPVGKNYLLRYPQDCRNLGCNGGEEACIR